MDALPGSLKHPVGNVARIGPANCFSICVDCFGELDRLGYRLVEQRMQKVDYELQRSLIVVVQDQLEVAGLGMKIGPGIVPPV